MTFDELNSYGEELEKRLLLRFSPLALKMLETAEDIPEGAIRPKKDRNQHLAICQAFAMVRRQRLRLALLKEDHWCVWPMIAHGLVSCEEGSPCYNEAITKIFVEDLEKGRELFKRTFPMLEPGKYVGVALAPLKTANFTPDMVMIYSNPAQLRSMVWAVKYKAATLIDSQFDAIDSCVYSTVPVLKNGGYRITLPDPGEYERAMAGEDEIILSLSADKLPELVEGLRAFDQRGFGYTQLAMDMRPDAPRPEFYNKLFAMWGLEVGQTWDLHK